MGNELFVIMVSHGDYDDYSQHPICITFSQLEAELLIDDYYNINSESHKNLCDEYGWSEYFNLFYLKVPYISLDTTRKCYELTNLQVCRNLYK